MTSLAPKVGDMWRSTLPICTFQNRNGQLVGETVHGPWKLMLWEDFYIIEVPLQNIIQSLCPDFPAWEAE